MPGLSDAHIHVLAGGEQLLTCNLEYAALTAAQFQARIQACLDEDDGAGADAWLQVVNWYRQAMVPPGTDATKATLDALETERPIIVASSDGHTTLVNSKALAGRRDHGRDPRPAERRASTTTRTASRPASSRTPRARWSQSKCRRRRRRRRATRWRRR